jgi:hypothetical protein
MDKLTVAMSGTLNVDSKDKLLIALLHYLLNILEPKEKDGNDRYQNNFAPKIRSLSVIPSPM